MCKAVRRNFFSEGTRLSTIFEGKRKRGHTLGDFVWGKLIKKVRRKYIFMENVCGGMVGELFAHFFFFLVSPINGGGGWLGPCTPL